MVGQVSKLSALDAMTMRLIADGRVQSQLDLEHELRVLGISVDVSKDADRILRTLKRHKLISWNERLHRWECC